MSARVREMHAAIDQAAAKIDTIPMGHVELHFGDGGIVLAVAERFPRRRVCEKEKVDTGILTT